MSLHKMSPELTCMVSDYTVVSTGENATDTSFLTSVTTAAQYKQLWSAWKSTPPRIAPRTLPFVWKHGSTVYSTNAPVVDRNCWMVRDAMQCWNQAIDEPVPKTRVTCYLKPALKSINYLLGRGLAEYEDAGENIELPFMNREFMQGFHSALLALAWNTASDGMGQGASIWKWKYNTYQYAKRPNTIKFIPKGWAADRLYEAVWHKALFLYNETTDAPSLEACTQAINGFNICVHSAKTFFNYRCFTKQDSMEKLTQALADVHMVYDANPMKNVTLLDPVVYMGTAERSLEDQTKNVSWMVDSAWLDTTDSALQLR